MKIQQYAAAEAEFIKLAKAMFGCMVRMLEAGASTAARSEPPDIPDQLSAPAVTSPPLNAPDLPSHDPQTSEVLDKPTDAEFLAGLEGLFGQCASEAEVKKCAEANKAEAEERGVEQAANDLVERRCKAIRKVKAEAKASAAKSAAGKAREPSVAEQEYIRIRTALRHIETHGTLVHLQTLWGNERAMLKTFPENWVKALTSEKDRIKALLQQKEAA